LDLSCNEIRTLDASFPFLPSLLVLSLPYNQIERVEEWGKGRQHALLPGEQEGREEGREGREEESIFQCPPLLLVLVPLFHQYE
jgi:hypothetical protein